MSKTLPIKSLATLVFAGLIAIPAGKLLFQAARAAGGQAPPVKMTKNEDHQRTMDLLHIAELRLIPRLLPAAVNPWRNSRSRRPQTGWSHMATTGARPWMGLRLSESRQHSSG